MASLKKRGESFQIQYYVNGKQKRIGLGQVPHQIAKEKVREFESAWARGEQNPFPTKTPIPDVLQAYVEHIRNVKTPKSAQTDVYYLREMFGPVCDGLKITSRKVTEASRKRPRQPELDRRRKVPVIEASYFEAITTRDIANFMTAHVRSRGLAPKTANRYREIIVRLFNWAMRVNGVRMPGDKNPAAAIPRRKEPAPRIRFLTLRQIEEQLDALQSNPQLQTMVAVYIYAGLRLSELLWLTLSDVHLTPGQPELIHVRSKTVNGEYWEPKTKQNRAIPISPDLMRYLTAYAPRPSRGSWLFPSPKGVRWDPDNFAATLRHANALAGLNWTCLHFRHTFGSQLAQKGISLYKISQLMGNSPDICRRHYAALLPEHMIEDVCFVSPNSGEHVRSTA